MASYFTNQPLYVCPPHHVGFLPPLHLPRALTVGRLVPLCQEEVSRAVRQQQLSEVWTVEYAQDLLLLGGLLPESVWLAYHLGDWKTAVPNGLYLPSPPLYCPQPSPSTQDHIGQFSEVALRHRVSGVLQRLLLLLRSAHCCHPAAQWYIGHLWHSRRMLLKMKKKYAYPSLDDEYVFPEGLKKVVTHAGFFRKTPDKKHLDSDTIHIITCFRELCALCWMLHIRDQLSVSCRKYQALRQHGRHEEIPVGPEMTSACVDALSWACRFLPFSCFLGVEEMLQDLLLSLLSELPSLSQVADTLVRAFLDEEESVRVPLREKVQVTAAESEAMQCPWGIKAKRGRDDAKQAKAESKRVQSECHPGGSSEDEQPSPPVFGVWEFELEDEEYLNFLELFFSYVLEKGGADEGELPLLKSFSSKLKERELHSLTFDVLTTVHRRQRDTHHLVRKHPGSDPPVFRAGCCYKPVKQDVKSELQLSAVSTEEPISRAAVGKKGTPLCSAMTSGACIPLPPTRRTVTPVLQPDVDRKLERESSVDTGYPGSANTPITGIDDSTQQAEPFIGPPTHEAEDLASVRTPLFHEPHQVTLDAQQREASSQLCLHDLHVSPERAGVTSLKRHKAALHQSHRIFPLFLLKQSFLLQLKCLSPTHQ
ncbi:hypothetical protein fugu_018977 [Takifugu bimaculatus]|uniref:Uncharacterized protein n=1 Tax=Takifugu bimaculatus TaxID=433685 RepID=A0A4Z2BI42_9TELE|nr:hypothetical protein fugu_018977 [Takifugu bimaculatus]